MKQFFVSLLRRFSRDQGGQNLTKLTAIFQAIFDSLTSPRLIPNGTA